MDEALLSVIRERCKKYIDTSDIAGKRPKLAAANITDSGILTRYVGGDSKSYIDVTISAMTPITLSILEETAMLTMEEPISGISDVYYMEAPHMSDNTASNSKYEMTLRFVYYTPHI